MLIYPKKRISYLYVPNTVEVNLNVNMKLLVLNILTSEISKIGNYSDCCVAYTSGDSSNHSD